MSITYHKRKKEMKDQNPFILLTLCHKSLFKRVEGYRHLWWGLKINITSTVTCAIDTILQGNIVQIFSKLWKQKLFSAKCSSVNIELKHKTSKCKVTTLKNQLLSDKGITLYHYTIQKWQNNHSRGYGHLVRQLNTK